MVGDPAHRVERKESQDEVMVVMSDVPIVFLAPITSQSAPATQHRQKLETSANTTRSFSLFYFILMISLYLSIINLHHWSVPSLGSIYFKGALVSCCSRQKKNFS